MISELRVEYPSDPSLRAVGRVAVIGVLLRLRTPMMAVEQFRSELNDALAAAAGENPEPDDTIALVARWDDKQIVVTITGPASVETITRRRIQR